MTTEEPRPTLSPEPTTKVTTMLWRRYAFIAGFVVLVVALAASLWPRRPQTIRLATGSEGGAQEIVGKALADAVTSHIDRVDMELLATGGGADNVAQLLSGQADMGIVPNDQVGDERLRSIAPLYREYLHIVVRGGITRVADLDGQRIATGPKGSHTAAITAWLLTSLGVTPTSVEHSKSHRQSAERLASGEVDVALVLAGMPTPAVQEMLSTPDTDLLSLADPDQVGSVLDGLRINAPQLVATVIPIGTYAGHPKKPVGTLGCDTLLLTRADVDDGLVRAFTEALFAHRAALGDRAPELARLTERFDPALLRFPVHAGAASFYARKEPPFIVEWADAISLFLTLILLMWSGAAALHTRIRRQRKDRVDRYYVKLQDIADRLQETQGLDDLKAVRDELRALRRQAFSELANERLAADESFTIFQDFLRSEIAEVDAAITQKGFSLPPPPG